jgi:molecular chaperone GrpE
MAKEKKITKTEKTSADPKIEEVTKGVEDTDAPELTGEEQIQELKDQNLRLYAEFENFRKRNARERLDLMSTASEKVIKAILPVIDDLDRALKNFPKESEERIGLDLIYAKLIGSLKIEGLKPMESAVGKILDVETMEAITTIPPPSQDQKGKVIDEIEKGYMLGSKIIRYSKVVVADSTN